MELKSKCRRDFQWHYIPTKFHKNRLTGYEVMHSHMGNMNRLVRLFTLGVSI